MRRAVTIVTTMAVLMSAVYVPVPTRAGGPFGIGRKKGPVERLAERIDEVERHIEEYGTVVPKHMDVWGESRLTSHRRDFETEIKKELDQFGETINAAISRSDQAFLANAFALQAAISGGTAATQALPNSDGTESVTRVEIPNADAGSQVDGFSTVIKRTDSATRQLQGFSGNVALEPVVKLDQMKRYLDHLNQIRRGNEGDDTADAPGYSLNLVRIPVSILPGKCTRQCYGAEVNCTITPHYGEEFLPQTWRNLVVNDVVDLLGLPVTKVIRDRYTDDKFWKEIEGELETPTIPTTSNPKGPTLDPKALHTTNADDEGSPRELALAAVKDAVKSTSTAVNVTVGAGKTPIPPSQVDLALGDDTRTLLPVLQATYRATKNSLFTTRSKDGVHLADVRQVLKREVQAAYEFLSEADNNVYLWRHCTHDLARAFKLHQKHEVVRIFNDFNDDVGRHFAHAVDTPKASLAWVIILESALLNDRLNEDLKVIASSKNCHCIPPGYYQFAGPNPDPGARVAFKEYCKCRWPIHVFAVDPVTQDQNVADSFSLRRELQLALSLAFASGNVNAQNFTRFARRIELDQEAIALNRTHVGFSHGTDTFGWRFYPRVQSPEIKSNLSVAVGDLLIGGPSRDDLLEDHRLEPGIRECTAIVLMPSFVPYLTVDTRSNWFKLTDPSRKRMDTVDSVRLSRSITELRHLTRCCMADAHLYRNGEVYRLCRTVEQLDERLPMQTKYVQVPYENTLGGFEMFSSGVTDLAPELLGFYGQPGIRKKEGVSSTLFVVGRKFSIHETKAVAGNRLCDVEVMSRNVVKLIIPGDVEKTEAQDGGEVVDVRIATPHGVSNNLFVPVLDDDTASAAAAAVEAHEAFHHPHSFSLDSETARACTRFDDGTKRLNYLRIQDPKLTISDTSAQNFDLTDYDVRGYVYVLDGDGAELEKEVFEFSGPITFNRDDAHVQDEAGGNTLLNRALVDALGVNTPHSPVLQADGAAQLRVRFWLRATGDRLPAVRVSNELLIDLEHCPEDCCEDDPAVPARDGLFDLPPGGPGEVPMPVPGG